MHGMIEQWLDAFETQHFPYSHIPTFYPLARYCIGTIWT
jgi:hypothetical protein